MKEPRALEEYRRAIVAACPELADATFAILASGWHSTAVEVGGRWVFKFPRGAEAEAALLREAAVLRLVRPAVSLPVPAPQVFAGPPLFSRHEKLPGGYLLGEDYRRLDEPARQAVGDALGRFYAEPASTATGAHAGGWSLAGASLGVACGDAQARLAAAACGLARTRGTLGAGICQAACRSAGFDLRLLRRPWLEHGIR